MSTISSGVGMSWTAVSARSEEHTSELQSLTNLVCRLLLEKKKHRKNLLFLRNASLVKCRGMHRCLFVSLQPSTTRKHENNWLKYCHPNYATPIPNQNAPDS